MRIIQGRQHEHSQADVCGEVTSHPFVEFRAKLKPGVILPSVTVNAFRSFLRRQAGLLYFLGTDAQFAKRVDFPLAHFFCWV
jgi:hypothetical protein